jgi:hypothetical protein
MHTHPVRTLLDRLDDHAMVAALGRKDLGQHGIEPAP